MRVVIAEPPGSSEARVELLPEHPECAEGARIETGRVVDLLGAHPLGVGRAVVMLHDLRLDADVAVGFGHSFGEFRGLVGQGGRHVERDAEGRAASGLIEQVAGASRIVGVPRVSGSKPR